MTTKEWVLKIASAVEHWSTMPRDSVEVAMSVETPRHVVEYTLTTMPAEQREAVRRALPPVITDNFALEARRIREAAEKL